MVSLSGTRGVTMLFAVFALLALLHFETCSATSLPHFRRRSQLRDGLKDDVVPTHKDVVMYTVARPCGSTKAYMEKFFADTGNSVNVFYGYEPNAHPKDKNPTRGNLGNYKNDYVKHFGKVLTLYAKRLHEDKKKPVTKESGGEQKPLDATREPPTKAQASGQSAENLVSFENAFKERKAGGTVQGGEGATRDKNEKKGPQGGEAGSTGDEKEKKRALLLSDEITEEQRTLAIGLGHEALRRCSTFLESKRDESPRKRAMYQMNSLQYETAKALLSDADRTKVSKAKEINCLIACGVANAFSYEKPDDNKDIKSCSIAIVRKQGSKEKEKLIFAFSGGYDSGYNSFLPEMKSSEAPEIAGSVWPLAARPEPESSKDAESKELKVKWDSFIQKMDGLMKSFEKETNDAFKKRLETARPKEEPTKENEGKEKAGSTTERGGNEQKKKHNDDDEEEERETDEGKVKKEKAKSPALQKAIDEEFEKNRAQIPVETYRQIGSCSEDKILHKIIRDAEEEQLRKGQARR